MRSPFCSCILGLVILVIGLSACTSRYTAPVEQIGDRPRFLDDGRQHLVNGGETLYAIAWMYDLDVNALARANNLPQPYTVAPGTLLTVDPRVVGGTASNTAVAAVSSAPVGTAVVTAIPSIGGLQRTPLPSAPLPSTTLPSTTLPSGNTPPVTSNAPTATATPPGNSTTPSGSSTEGAATSPRITPTAPIATLPPSATPAPSPTARVTPPPSEPELTLPKSEPPPAVAPVGRYSGSGAIAWDWPHRGNIVTRFTDAAVEGKGVDLAGSAGDPVLAAAEGEVVYAGGGLQRYGNLLILKHNDHFLSAYAHNRSLLVKEGDVVSRGQKIAELGSSGVDREMLHFEIRQDGKPVDPLLFLPSR